MKRIGIVSDSHGSKLFLEAVAKELKDCDIVYHLGDCTGDADYLQTLGLKVIGVPGNNDFCLFEDTDKVDVQENVRILLTHGHRYGVRHSLMRLSLCAQEKNCAVALYGHTHVADWQFYNGILFLNPGALCGGKYAEIEIKDNGIYPYMKKVLL